jgi:hypothetical protein
MRFTDRSGSAAAPPKIPGSEHGRLRSTVLAFGRLWPRERPTWCGDAIVPLGLAVILYVGVRLAIGAPSVIKGRGISLSPAVLPSMRPCLLRG